MLSKVDVYDTVTSLMWLHVFGCPLPINMSSLLLSVEEPMLLGAEDDREERPALVPSLFPLIPPTLYFSTASEKGQDTLISPFCCVKQIEALTVVNQGLES